MAYNWCVLVSRPAATATLKTPHLTCVITVLYTSTFAVETRE